MPEYLVIGQASWSETVEAKDRREAIRKFSRTIPKALPDHIAISISVADEVNYTVVWNKNQEEEEEKSND